MRFFTPNKIMTAIATVVFTSGVYAADGIDSSTGYAENYATTGDEMILDFDDVSWNVINVESASELEDALEDASPGDKIIIAAGTYIGNFELNVGGTQNNPI
ncbi:MAG: hypothetical protein ACSHWR_05520, partial [Psychromonas sp.]